jgi:large subunit ribosomal protein L36
MKIKRSLRALKSKPGAQVVKRGKRVYVLNRKTPRLKARQG